MSQRLLAGLKLSRYLWSSGRMQGLSGLSGLSGLVYSSAAAAAFAPTDLSGLVLWLKADSGAYKDAGSALAADGETVQQWNDQSAGSIGNATQATGAARFTYKTNVINGLPALLGNGTGTYIATGNTGLSGDITATAFVVCKPADTTTDACLWAFGNSGAGLSVWSLFQSITDAKYSIQAAGGNAFNDSASYTTAAQIVTVTKSAGAINTTTVVYLNGTAGSDAGSSSTNTPTITNGALVLGRWNGTSQYYYNGHLAEFLLYSRVLPAGERSQVHAYLGTKYAITVA